MSKATGVSMGGGVVITSKKAKAMHAYRNRNWKISDTASRKVQFVRKDKDGNVIETGSYTDRTQKPKKAAKQYRKRGKPTNYDGGVMGAYSLKEANRRAK